MFIMLSTICISGCGSSIGRIVGSIRSRIINIIRMLRRVVCGTIGNRNRNISITGRIISVIIFLRRNIGNRISYL